jgi:predicted CoA-substrate-specific enzyme activase
LAYAIGVDLGSTAIKAVLVKDEVIQWYKMEVTAPGQERLAQSLIDSAMADFRLTLADLDHITATGYGKGLYLGAGHRVDEISANALGLFRLSNGNCRTIVNIGGQDLKVIHLDPDGKVSEFRMNDKCAAGTGRFFEQVARILDIPLEELGRLALESETLVELNSTCVVFAESEIVSLLAKGVDKAAIARGFHQAVARRVAHLMGRRAVENEGAIYLDGGPSQNNGLLLAIEDELMSEIKVLPNPQYTVAFGAALSASLFCSIILSILCLMF